MGWGPSPFGWFPSGLNQEPGFRLDIISLLAVIGEYSMAEQAQPLTASWFCVLPRLLPAPQVLLKASRPFRMPDAKAKVVGVKSGTVMETLNYFPNILHPLDKLKPLQVQVYRITYSNKASEDCELSDGKKRGKSQNTANNISQDEDIEMTAGCGEFRRPFRQATIIREHQPTKIPDPNRAGEEMPEPLVPVKKYSLLKMLDIGSFILTLIILFVCIWNRDGIACMALGTLSSISSIVGFASKWTPALTRRTSIAQAPRGDVMVRTREGGFILILCEEEVARELYFGNEQCVYHVGNTVTYRALVGTATFMLMSSVILLGNCKFIQQAAIGAAYIFLNFAYWMVSLVKRKHFWDLSRYHHEDMAGDRDWAEFIRRQEKLNSKHSYTCTLWYAIYASGCTDWCRMTDATPKTDAWTQWLRMADENAIKDNKDWDPVKSLNALIKPDTRDVDGIPRTQNEMDDLAKLDRLESQYESQLQEVRAMKQRRVGQPRTMEEPYIDEVIL